MPRVKGVGKRELKKQTKANIASSFQDRGLKADDHLVHIENRRAGSVDYQVVKFVREDKQAIAAIYGSLQYCAAVWVKEDAFMKIRAILPDDAHVEDVSPFRRGFQWAIHIKSPNSILIPMIADACVSAGIDRLNKTIERRELEVIRAEKRADREVKKAAERRDWKDTDPMAK
tara:strand:+ start:1209 stop:1727 length:519 start_codon:yes stop_codon:yes gene_type:complete